MREIVVRSGVPAQLDADMIAVVVHPQRQADETLTTLDNRLGGALGRLMTQGAFKAEPNQSEFFASPVPDGPHVLAIGSGDVDVASAETLRQAAGISVREARTRHLTSVAFILPPAAGIELGWGPAVQAVAEGLALGDWSFDDLRGEAGRQKLNPPPARGIIFVPEPVREAESAATRGRVIAEAQNYARGLVARPGNVATPGFMAAQAERLAEEHGLRVQTWGPERLRELGFGALLAVAKGSSQEPRFILLEHRGAEGPPYVVVGKGVTFDSGGISLKPPAGMAEE